MSTPMSASKARAFAPSATAQALLRRVRRLGLIEAALWVLPAWALLRFASAPWPALWTDVAALLVLLAIAGLRTRQRSTTWLAQRLNQRLPSFEDSAGLLFTPGTGALAALQRQRLERRLPRVTLAALDLRAHSPWMLLPILLAAAVLLLPAQRMQGSTLPAAREAAAAEADAPLGPPSLQSTEVRIRPPRYTGLTESTQAALDIEAVAGSRIDWALEITPAPSSAALVFIDGRRIELQLADTAWRGSDTPEASSRYRVEIDGAVLGLDDAAARLELKPDQPPQIRVRRPGQTLNIVESAAAMELDIEASDDFGLGAAELLLTLAKGDGELVEVSEQRLALRGEGDARSRRYLRRLDLGALGFETGNDLILRVEVLDSLGQRARSPSYILRWPKLRDTEGEGVEGFVQRTLPAYFRSQRQIIIDTEALIAERAALERERLLARSDSIGVDQRLLRLRYGEFLGEDVETEGPLLPEGHSLDDGHGHADPASFGDAASLVRAYGHMHDQEEGTTLFDPVTRERLRSALREMWQSELHLRMGDPVAALPYQYRALDLIKQIQQASRIYLARVGLELPPIMFSRRLTGDRSTAVRPGDPLRAAERGDAALVGVFSALAGRGFGIGDSGLVGGEALADAAPAPDVLAAFESWLTGQPIESTLDLRERFDRVRRDPDCADCRAALASSLWQRIAPPPQGPRSRAGLDVAGEAWLRALEDAR
ncbi:MAG: hypothetical protein H4O13_17500 [Xanthomonadales bacterium]|nr:hypothetical protein [Xanthomonadales bacterium]